MRTQMHNTVMVGQPGHRAGAKSAGARSGASGYRRCQGSSRGFAPFSSP